ncbi:MAG: hypothetical protein ACOYYI_07640 [Chloroflexota bacterium]
MNNMNLLNGLRKAGFDVSEHTAGFDALWMHTLPEEFNRALECANGSDRAKEWLGNMLTRAGIAYSPPRKSDRALPRAVRVFGNQSAFCFETDITRSGQHTVAIEGALAKEGGGFDWDRKIRVQVTAPELPYVAAVMLGLIPMYEASNHGQERKGYSFQRQPDRGSMFVRVFAAKQPPRAMPIVPGDLFYVSGLVISQLSIAVGGIDPSALPIILRGSIGLSKSHANER